MLMISGSFENISIHTSRMGCDQFDNLCFLPVNVFQSTHPAWDVTLLSHSFAHASNISIHTSRMGCDKRYWNESVHVESISIHTSRMGCDYHSFGFGYRSMEFQSTHPAWDVTMQLTTWNCRAAFQSTHPAWDVTIFRGHRSAEPCISIHTSRMGCDNIGPDMGKCRYYFNPHIPHGM